MKIILDIDVESIQDELIEEECVKRNFKLSDFYAADGKYLLTLLG